MSGEKDEDTMTHYETHLSKLIQWERGARAERQGFQDARHFPELLQFSTDQYEQLRYASGWADGRAILTVEGQA